MACLFHYSIFYRDLRLRTFPNSTRNLSPLLLPTLATSEPTFAIHSEFFSITIENYPREPINYPLRPPYF